MHYWWNPMIALLRGIRLHGHWYEDWTGEVIKFSPGCTRRRCFPLRLCSLHVHCGKSSHYLQSAAGRAGCLSPGTPQPLLHLLVSLSLPSSSHTYVLLLRSVFLLPALSLLTLASLAFNNWSCKVLSVVLSREKGVYRVCQRKLACC